ncbi:Transmembrane protein [Comamonas aquatilis]|uniref:hypothetical protein n=1 Tax=Comamonas aquatilis TaxID=1778406 RepID=UPI0039F0278A
MRNLPATARQGMAAAMLGWLWLALLWGASHWLVFLPPWAWLLAVATLAALPAWGLWLALMLRKRVLHHQFAPQGRIRRCLSGGWWPAIKALVLALLLSGSSLLQAWFLAPWEWALLAAAPLLHGLLLGWLQTRLDSEFSQPAFTWAWCQRLARWLLVAVLGGLWLWSMARSVDYGRALAPGMSAQALDAAIASIRQAPSGWVRWGLDSLLALQVAGGAVTELPQLPALRLLLLALFGPVGVLLCLGCALQGAAGGRAIWLQARPPAQDRRGTAVLLGLVGVLLAGILVQTGASVDGLLRTHESPLALQRLPECERIGQQLYRLGTLEATRQQALQALGQIKQAQLGQALCTGAGEVRKEMDAAIERYLDWYFSLGAEWGRVFSLLTGDVGVFLQDKLTSTLGQAKGLDAWMQAVQQQGARSGAALQEGQQRINETLARHHLALDASQCIVRVQVPQLPALDLLGEARQRLAASAVAGTGAGALAAVVAAKAMAKTSMKAASKVLAKAAAKQGIGKAGAAAAGAALGSVVPGVGTVAGAVVGALAGAVIGVGVDWAALYAEELLTRDAMRADLQAALGAQLGSMSQALGCE